MDLGHLKNTSLSKKLFIRKCHVCGAISEGQKELERCHQCHKSFLPLNYFEKIHTIKAENYSSHFENCEDLDSQDLIKGIIVIWD